MSWDGYLKGFLTEKPEFVGMLASAGIYSQQGAKCAAAGDELEIKECTDLVAIINEEKKGEPAVLKGKKYQQIMLNKDEKKAYFKVQGGGMCVALTNTLLIYGVYDTAKKGTCKGKEKAQNQGDCATLVEALQEQLAGSGS